MKQKRLILTILILGITAMISSQIGHDIYYILKPLTTILIVLLALKIGTKSIRPYFQLSIAALVFCLIGDSLLLNPDFFVFGLVAFLIGHLLFAASFISKVGVSKNIWPLLPLLAFAIGFYIYMYEGLGALAMPVAVYIGVIVMMSWQGISMRYKQPSWDHDLIAIGVLLFMLSDSILAYNKFVNPLDYSAIYILSTYWAAILLLAYATSGSPTNTNS